MEPFKRSPFEAEIMFCACGGNPDSGAGLWKAEEVMMERNVSVDHVRLALGPAYAIRTEPLLPPELCKTIGCGEGGRDNLPELGQMDVLCSC